MTVILETVSLVRRFGGLIATNDVSMSLHEGARHALIGPNGAGKTTFVNLLTGALKPTSGRILLEGVDITREPAHKRVGRGMARTFQINQLFPDLTPLQTVTFAVLERRGSGIDAIRSVASHTEAIDEAADILERFRLADVMGWKTSDMPYGKQRLLEIAVAIAARPKVLLLDEPAAGVPEGERHEILDMVNGLPKSVAVLLIEHDMDLVFSFAERISVLVNGALLVEGTTQEVAEDPRVRTAYLGEDADA